jgi:hypothetical protein
MQIYEAIRNGELPGLSRAWDLPERTFFQTLERVRRKFPFVMPVTEPVPTADARLERIRAKAQELEALAATVEG